MAKRKKTCGDLTLVPEKADCHSACNSDPLSRGIGVQN